MAMLLIRSARGIVVIESDGLSGGTAFAGEPYEVSSIVQSIDKVRKVVGVLSEMVHPLAQLPCIATRQQTGTRRKTLRVRRVAMTERDAVAA